MKRQQRTIGSIIEIDLGNNDYAYAQILENGIVFFDHKEKCKLEDITLLAQAGILFILAVYDEVITKGIWPKVGKLPIRKELEVLPMKFIQDALNPNRFELYNPNTGEITPTTKDKVIGLEKAVVWANNHVEERIRDHYAGRKNVWVERFKVE